MPVGSVASPVLCWCWGEVQLLRCASSLWVARRHRQWGQLVCRCLELRKDSRKGGALDRSSSQAGLRCAESTGGAGACSALSVCCDTSQPCTALSPALGVVSLCCPLNCCVCVCVLGQCSCLSSLLFGVQNCSTELPCMGWQLQRLQTRLKWSP